MIVMLSATQRVLNGESQPLRRLDLFYDNANSLESARELVYEVRPAWQNATTAIELTRFDDGITNTVCCPKSTISMSLMVP